MKTINNRYLTIFSSYSKDKIVNKVGKITAKRGGPLFFIEKALKKIDVPFKSFCGSTINVEIKVGKKDEVGKILGLPAVNHLPKSNISDCILVSTVFNEWNLSEISKLNAKIFVDIQGYVRQANKLGRKKMWRGVDKFADRIYCLKGTKEEMSYLPRDVFENQKKRLLIITDGEKDVVYYFRGKKYSRPVVKAVNASDTIGAGDTFFGYFVGYLAKGLSVHRAIAKAIIDTSKFVSHKISVEAVPTMKCSVKNILFLVCTHGDEDFAIPLLKRLQKSFPKDTYLYEWLIANPLAKKQNARFIDSDLNRSAPGDKNSKSYEERRAYELVRLSKDFEAVIDLHGAVARCGIVAIISNPNKHNISLARLMGIKRNIIWKSSNRKNGSITYFAKCPSIGIECGPKVDPDIKNGLFDVLKIFLKRRKRYLTRTLSAGLNSRGRQEFYEVYGKKEGSHNSKVRDFVITNDGKERFFPFLSNQYKGISCYKMRKISLKELKFISRNL